MTTGGVNSDVILGANQNRKPRLAVWKFASCDGCQLSLLDCEDELLTLAGQVEIAYFLEASRDTAPGPYDISLVEGSITTVEDAERIQEIRRQSRLLVTIGACATAGGIQALRNGRDLKDFVRTVYAHPQYIEVLQNSTAIAEHVAVDYELRGCPINKQQLLEVLGAFLVGRKPQIENCSVCIECKRRGTVCIMVAQGVTCLGPVTHAGCNALCPSFNRGCFGCYGPREQARPAALSDWLCQAGKSKLELQRLLQTFNTKAPAFDQEAKRLEQQVN